MRVSQHLWVLTGQLERTRENGKKRWVSENCSRCSLHYAKRSDQWAQRNIFNNAPVASQLFKPISCEKRKTHQTFCPFDMATRPTRLVWKEQKFYESPGADERTTRKDEGDTLRALYISLVKFAPTEATAREKAAPLQQFISLPQIRFIIN